jgi:hypothetical protein
VINRESLLEQDVKSALNWAKTFKYFRFVLAVILTIAYFMGFSFFFSELLVFSVVSLLFLPMGFTDTFFEKHLEYNTILLENRQKLNAEETNKHLTKAFEEIEMLKDRLDIPEHDEEY